MRLVMTVAAISLAATIAQGCKFVSVNKKALKELSNLEIIDIDESNPDRVTKTYDVADFSAIECAGGYEVDYSIGEPYLSISAPSKVMEYLVVSCNDGVLKLSMNNKRVRNTDAVKVTVRSGRLNKVEVAGAVEFDSKEILTDGEFRMEVSGAGEVDIDRIAATDVILEVNGAGEIDIKGLDCNNVDVQVNGAGSIELKGYSKNARIEVNGAGNVDAREFNCPGLKFEKHGLGVIRR